MNNKFNIPTIKSVSEMDCNDIIKKNGFILKLDLNLIIIVIVRFIPTNNKTNYLMYGIKLMKRPNE